MSPTARTLKALRDSNYAACVVERWLPRIGRRADFMGFADILAVRRTEAGVLAIQATSRAHVGDRLARAQQRPELAVWLASGNRFEVWGWCKIGSRWQVKRVAVKGEDLAGVPVAILPRRKRARPQKTLFD